MASEHADLPPSDALRYHARRRAYRIAALISQPVTLACVAFTAAPALFVERLRQAALPEPAVRAAYAAALYAFLWAVSMVWGYLAGYRLEKRYGMMRLSWASWMLRRVKAAGIGLAVFVSGCVAVLWVIDRYGPSWWWIAATLLAALSWIGALVYPNLIVPLFHRLSPLSDERLRERLMRVCADCGIRRPDLRQIDLSKISRRANAAVMGVAGTRKIVLSDTLLTAFTPEEIDFVLYHELGHHAERHIPLQLVWNTVVIYAALWAGDALLPTVAASWGRDAFSLEFLPVWLLCAGVADLVGGPAALYVSRRLEKRADAYALRKQRRADIARSALTKLSRLNLAHPAPPAWEEWLFYTHPSLPERLRHVRTVLPD